jgi:hypothetical protein
MSIENTNLSEFTPRVKKLINEIIDAVNTAVKVTAVSAAGAITIAQGIVAVTATSAAALTLAAPSSVDGTIIRIVSTTAFAHKVTFTGGTLKDGTATAKTTATFAAYAGAQITVMAYGSNWYLIDSVAATLA